MPSPDVTAYNTLTLYDVDPQDLVAGAIQDRTTVMPDYDPHEGDPDVELMGSLASISAEMVYALNRVPNGNLEVLGRFLGVVRSEGTPAVASIVMNVTPNPLGVEVRANTAFSLDLGDGTTVIFLTDQAVVSGPNATTLTATATATINGTVANNVAAGTTLGVRSPVTAINSATLGAATSGGTDAESDSSWQSRVVTTLARMNSTLVTPEHFKAYAATWPGVYRALAINNWDGTGTVGAQPGYMTVAVRAQGGAAVPAPTKTALAAAMDAAAIAILTVNVVDATITTLTVACAVHVLPAYATGPVTAAAKAKIEAYLNPDAWEWNSTVRANEIIALADGVEGVDYVASVTVNGGATVTLGATALPSGTATVSTV